MNRYNRGPTIGGPSKATASTTCQKCLKKGHYSYECKAVIQERPYVSRPSRTQQLLNPKLVPKLTSDVPQDLMRKKGVADEQLAKLEQERGRKRNRQSEDPEIRGASKRMRSASSASSSSVSTISTGISRSPTPPAHAKVGDGNERTSAPRSPRQRPIDFEKKRRRDSVSSVDSYSSENRMDEGREYRERASSRSTRRKIQQHSPPARGRRTESRSPQRGGRRRLSNDRHANSMKQPRYNRSPISHSRKENRPPPRERSLSPFSKRLALTQSMNMGR